MKIVQSKPFLVFVTVFLLAAIPVTTYLVIQSERTAREPQAATVCTTNCESSENTSSEFESISADFNSDGKVNSDDLAIMVSNVGKKGDNEADLNNDNIVGEADLVLLQAQWSKE